MAYSSINHLKKILAIQELYNKYHEQGFSNTYIYNQYIYPQYLISESTFYNYLKVPAKKKLRELNYEEQEVKPVRKYIR